ncbi:MAG TPA: FtsW/RodA/SpoVE family cell cycle protein [Candidatus Aphodovivens avistercoris]|nr:FtsW/RodA/SpoVE family cell cycle protein [Candidatus Aphodovivens avistercoris]
MTRRNLELVLLCIAAPLVILMFAMLVANQGQPLNVNTLGVPIGIFAAFVFAHIAVRRLAPGADPAILPLTFALSGIGIAFVTRLRPELAVGQLMWLFLGVAFMVVVLLFVRNLDKLARYKYTLMLVGIALLVSPLLPFIGQEIYGSRIWLFIGPFSFQPGEIAKIAIVLFLAGYLAANREMLSVFTWRVGPLNLPDIRTLLPLLVMWLISLGIVAFEKDLGSALVFFFVFLVMIYVATGKKTYVIVGVALMAAGAVGLYFVFDHVQVRVATWLDPFADAQNTGYQLVQTLYSLADGGMFGVGIGRGLAEQIPVVESDFIFAAIGEETGLLGAAGLLLLYLCFAIRGMVTAARAKSDVSSFTAVGLTAIIILQAFIIVGGVTKLIPLTGLTLPFVSQGGSSLLASFISVALLLRAGDEGTGVSEEMKSGTAMLHAGNVLGRVSLGHRLTVAMVGFSILFALLVANLTLIMVVQAEAYQSMPGNNHTMAKEADTERGSISTYDGVVLAESQQTEDGTYERVYPAGDLASHVVGYYSERFGASGIEASENETLKGQQNFASWTDVINDAAGIETPGNDVKLTLNSTIQQAAQDALAGQTGACVVMDPSTGAVLAMASSPTYDAGSIEDLLAQASDGSEASSELFNRATQGLYAPGSTFKIVSLAAALENGIADEDDVFSSPGVMEIGNAEVTNFGDESYGNITLRQATAYSSNTVFGQLGTRIGSELLVQVAEKFGFGQDLDFELPVATSLMPDPDEMTEWETAWAAAGEPVGEHESPAGPQASVLEMAMVGCAIANQGTIMQPYLVDSVYNANGERSYQAQPSTYLQAVSAETANRVKDVLKDVVNSGTGTAAAVSGVQVAGKTGTAETGDGDNGWFVGMADANSDTPSVVVAIVLEDSSSTLASSKAAGVLSAALSVRGGV